MALPSLSAGFMVLAGFFATPLPPSIVIAGDWCPPSIGLGVPEPCPRRMSSLPYPTPRPPHMLAADAPQRICTLIRASADRHGLPPEFFARLIWKESRFDVKALSPVGAQGIAQFMPGTARERGLADPYDPEQAIPASARFLADLRAEFGNWGLAAAGYNGGPNRVARWLASGGQLPGETVDYVQSITFRPVEWFRKSGREVERRPLEKGLSFAEACRRLPVIATRAMGVATRSPWGAQVAAGTSRGAAARAFQRARARAGRAFGGRGAIYVRSRKVGGRRLWTARLGAGSRGEAANICNAVKRAGGYCVVRRN